MKKLLTLMLVLGLILGLAAPAWAETISASISPSGVLGRNQDITVTINIAGMDQSGNVTYTLRSDPVVGSFSGTAPTYTHSLNTSTIASTNKLTYILTKTVDSGTGNPDIYEYSQEVSFSIAPQPPVLASSNIAISCPTCGTTYNPSVSNGALTFLLPSTCVANSHTLNISVTGISSADFDISYPNGSTIPAGALTSGTRTVVVSNKATPKDSTSADISIARGASSDTKLKSLSVAGTAYTDNATIVNPTSSSAAKSFTLANSVSSAAISAQTNDSAASVSIYGNHSASGSTISSLSLTQAGTAYSFCVKVIAPSGATQTYYYYITRQAGSTNANLTSVKLKSGSTELASSSGNGSTSSSNPTALSVPNAYTSATIEVTKADSTASVAIYSGLSGSSTISSLSSLVPGTAQYFRVVVTPQSGSAATYYYSVTRATNTAILSSITFTYTPSGGSSTTLGNVGAISGDNSQSLNLNTTYTSATLKWTLADGATFVSGKWGSSTLSAGQGSSGYSASLPSSGSTALELKIRASNGTTYTATINVSRSTTTSTAILKSVTFKSGSSTVGSITTAISGTTSKTLNLSTSSSSATVSWVLADGATLNSAKWDGGSSNISSGSSVTLPTGSNNKKLVLEITASNNTKYTATITVTRNASSSTSLSSLYIKNKVTSSTNDSNLFETSPKSFSSGTTKYTVYVGSDYGSVYIYPELNNSDAYISVSGTYSKKTDRFSSNGYYQIDLRSGSNTVYLEISDDNDNSTKYTLEIEQEDDVDSTVALTALVASKSSSSTNTSNKYDLTPSFSTNKLNYDLDLAKSVSEVYFHLTTRRSEATITPSNASEVSTGVYKASISSNQSKTVSFTIKNGSKSAKYSVTINSGGATNQARLSRIRVASRESANNSYQYTMLPTFDGALTEYMVLAPYDSSTAIVYIQGTLNDKDDYLTIEGEDAEDGEWFEYEIKAGKTEKIKLVVEDVDGKTTTYTLNIVTAPKSADDDATLDSLSLRKDSSSSSTIALSPSFSSSTTSYTTENVANSVDSLRVYAEGYNSSAILVNDTPLTGDYVTIDLAEGKNEIKIKVYAEDCETDKTYTVTVNRGAAGSLDSSLSGLELRVGNNASQTINLIPAFSKTTTIYNANVEDSATQISFRPTATDSGATIRLLGATLTSGQWSSYNALNRGANTFIFTVTAGSGGTSLYTVTVTRGLTVQVSAQKLLVNGADVTCAAYNINGNNYFKLRDLAYALRGTPKHFNVTYNSVSRSIYMTSGQDYSIIGGEMTRPSAPGKYQLSNQAVQMDGRTINLTAYNIDGNNYFMLREIGQTFDFGVTYNDATTTMIINTGTGYTQ